MKKNPLCIPPPTGKVISPNADSTYQVVVHSTLVINKQICSVLQPYLVVGNI